MERAGKRRLCCLHCHLETDLDTWRRRHEPNTRTCIEVNPEARMSFMVAMTRYQTGWEEWTAEAEARIRAYLQWEHTKVLARQRQREALAESA